MRSSALDKIDDAARTLKTKVDTAEKQLAGLLGSVVEAASVVLRTAILAGLDSLETLGKFTVTNLAPYGLLHDEVLAINEARGALSGVLKQWADPPPSLPPPATIRALLDRNVTQAITVRALFEQDVFQQANTDLRAAEGGLLASLVGLQRRIAGLPQALQDAVAQAAREAGVVAALAEFGQLLLKTRNDVLEKADNVPVLARSARHALMVMPDAAFGRAACPADQPGPLPPLPPLEACDRLAQEAALLTQAALPQSKPGALVAYLASWQRQSAAPLVIQRQIADAVTDFARGNIGSVLDLGAYRDEIEDAIANLIPVKTTLSYTFASTVEKDPGPGELFQPRPGPPSTSRWRRRPICFIPNAAASQRPPSWGRQHQSDRRVG